MRCRWFLQACIVLAVGVGLVSCTTEQLNQVMNRPAEIIQSSSPCPPAEISTATPEFCVNLTEIRLLNHDSEADVSLTLVNRTGRRLFLALGSSPYLTDSSGTKWNLHKSTGIAGMCAACKTVPLEPNVEMQLALLFGRSGQAPSDLTFSMRGEIAIMKVDSRGEPIFHSIGVNRGFNLSGIRIKQQPRQSGGPTDRRPEAALTVSR